MRLIILIALGLTLCSALPQRGLSLRGSRRISLSSRDNQPEGPEDAGTPETPAEPEAPVTRKGTSLRRGRPSPLKSKTGDQSTSSTGVVPASQRSEGRQTTQANPQPTNERKSLSIRRPKKPTTTTTTTTTTLAPEVESVMPEMVEEMVNEEEKLMMDDKEMMSNPELADKEAEAKTEKAMEKKVAATPEKDVQEETEVMEKVNEPQSESPRPKLRPVPIKIGRRTNAETPVKELREEDAASPGEPKVAQSDDGVSQHRFAGRTRASPVSIRTRGNSRSQGESQSEPAATETAQAPSPRIRSRGSSAPRIGTRRSQQPVAEVPEQSLDVTATDAEGEEVSALETESSFPDLSELQTIIRQNDGGKQNSRIKVKRLRTRPVQTTQPLDEEEQILTTVQENEITENPLSLLDDISDPPLSNAARKGKGDPTASSTQPLVEPEIRSATNKITFPTPNYGGTDLIIRGGEVHVTQIGTVEDTPPVEVKLLLRGFGGRRRGLARPLLKEIPAAKTRTQSSSNTIDNLNSKSSATLKGAQSSSQTEDASLSSDLDYIYDNYDYAYEEVPQNA